MQKQFQTAVIVACLVVFCIGADAARGEKFSAELFVDGDKTSHEISEILIKFNYEIQKESLEDKIELNDGAGEALSGLALEIYPGDSEGRTVSVKIPDESSLLNESSHYSITVKKGLRYVRSVAKNGDKRYAKLAKDIELDFVTSSMDMATISTMRQTR